MNDLIHSNLGVIENPGATVNDDPNDEVVLEWHQHWHKHEHGHPFDVHGHDHYDDTQASDMHDELHSHLHYHENGRKDHNESYHAKLNLDFEGFVTSNHMGEYVH